MTAEQTTALRLYRERLEAQRLAKACQRELDRLIAAMDTDERREFEAHAEHIRKDIEN